MLVQKIVKAQGEFAKVGEDFKDEDILIIKDAGLSIAGTYGDRHVFKVSTKNGEKNLAFNQTSMNNVIDAYGANTDEWVGKSVKAYIVKQMIDNSLKKVCYLVGDGWTMTDDGKFVNTKTATKVPEIKYPTEEEEGIDTDNIDF